MASGSLAAGERFKLMLRPLFLSLALLASPALAQSAWEPGPELQADTQSAIGAGFSMIEHWHNPAPAELVSAVLDPLVQDLQPTRPWGFESFYVLNQVVPDRVFLFVTMKGVDWDVPGEYGARIFGFVFDMEPFRWRLVLDTTAMKIGFNRYEIAAVQENGFVRYIWNGNEFSPSSSK